MLSGLESNAEAFVSDLGLASRDPSLHG